jgi:hypothetical protein
VKKPAFRILLAREDISTFIMVSEPKTSLFSLWDMSEAPKCPYEVMGLPRTASHEDIRKVCS